MSHVVTVDAEILDLDCLAQAAADVGLVFKKDQKTYRWYGRWMNDYSADDASYRAGRDVKAYGTCDHAIEVPGNPTAYSIGVVKAPDGKPGWKLEWDFYGRGRGLCDHIAANPDGKDAGKLMQAYTARVVRKAALKNPKHRILSQKKMSDGTVRIKVRVSS